MFEAPGQASVGLFATHHEARDAIGALKTAGISPHAISVLARSPSEAHALHQQTGAAEDLEALIEPHPLSDVLDLVGQIESVLVPGFGGVLGTGDLMAHIRAYLDGLRVRRRPDEERGPITGALVGLGVPAGEAANLQHAVFRGQILVVVHGTHDAAAARAALRASRGNPSQ